MKFLYEKACGPLTSGCQRLQTCLVFVMVRSSSYQILMPAYFDMYQGRSCIHSKLLILARSNAVMALRTWPLLTA